METFFLNFSFEAEPLEVETPNKTVNIKIKANPSKLVACSLCSREFRTVMALTCHMSKTHSVTVQSEKALQPQPPRSSATVCEYCDKIFHNQIRCQQHIKIAHERFRIQCDRCGGSFSDRQKLKAHLLKEHDGLVAPMDIIDSLYCTKGADGRKKCREKFNCRQELRHHLWRKHFITGEDAEKYVERSVLNSDRMGYPQDNSSVNVIPSISSEK